MWVEVRCTIVTSAPFSHSAPQMSKDELFDPITTAFLPAYASGPGCAEEWCWSPRNDVHARERREVRLAGHAGGEHQLLRAQHERLALALDLDGPLAGLLVVRRGLRLGARPVVELHHLGVGLEPVGDLVLGGEHRPVLGELDVGQVVVPDRVVQAQRLVAAAPLVAGTGPLVDDDRRHAELAQPGARARCRPGRRRRRARRAGSRSRARAPPARAARPRSRGPGWRRARRPWGARRPSAPRGP